MQNGEFDRCVVAITGNAFVCGDVIYDLSMRYAAGENWIMKYTEILFRLLQRILKK